LLQIQVNLFKLDSWVVPALPHDNLYPHTGLSGNNLIVNAGHSPSVPQPPAGRNSFHLWTPQTR